MRDVSCVWPAEAVLGEGPFWSVVDQAVWFVDIKRPCIHRLDSVSGRRQTWQTPDQVSFVLPLGDGCMIAGLPGRLVRFTPTVDTFSPLIVLPGERVGNRLNDACVDAKGRLWFGSMHDEALEASGMLYCWNGVSDPVMIDSGFVISNGPAHSPDGRILYHTDTLDRTIYRFDVAEDGVVANKRPFIQIENGAGLPDGTTVDSEGCLWVALFGGWAVRRYSASGRLLEKVALPCANVTKLALGGADFKTAFVTTAREGLSHADLDAQPLAGGLFTFQTDVAGLPVTACQF